MFDYIKRLLSPGESNTDSHHLGVRIWNPGESEAKIRLTIGQAVFDVPIFPGSGITEANDQSSVTLTVENLGEVDVIIEWKKSRD